MVEDLTGYVLSSCGRRGHSTKGCILLASEQTERRQVFHVPADLIGEKVTVGDSVRWNVSFCTPNRPLVLSCEVDRQPFVLDSSDGDSQPKLPAEAFHG